MSTPTENQADLRVEGHLPSLAGAAGWLNSTPLTADDLRGKVVLIDFWTYTCINWLRTLGFVRAWAEKYEAQGLVVIGVHTPEFPFERDTDNVRRAAEEMRIEYPIALDPGYEVWDAFANHYWPAVYIADAEGRIRYHHFGEGAYEECERVIQALLREAGRDVGTELVSVPDDGVEMQADWATLESPETYLGYGQARNFASRGGAEPDEPLTYAAPDRLALNTWALAGGWTVERRAAVLNRADGRIGVPLPRSRRQSRHGTAVSRGFGPVRRAHRRRASGRRSRPRRRRARSRHGLRPAALSAGSRARTDQRPHVRDHLPPPRGRGVRVYVRLGQPPLGGGPQCSSTVRRSSTRSTGFER